MNISKKIITSFNSPNTLLVISKYPYKDVARSYHGVANYTKETLTTIARNKQQKIVVLVQKEYGRKIEYDAEKKILIVPAFGDGLKIYAELWNWMCTFHKIQKVIVHSEYYTSGKAWQMATSPFFLLSMKLLGKNVAYFAHNVLDNFSFIATHLGKKRNDPAIKFFETVVPAYYKLLAFSVNQLVALDAAVVKRLSKFISHDRISLAPIWVYPQAPKAGQRKYWRKKLNIRNNELVLMSYGFVTHYKGSDWLVNTVNELTRKNEFLNVKLIIAGGQAPSQQGTAHYQQFYNKIARTAASNPRIILTGFLPEKEVSRYFSVADVVILPYRGMLGSSATWASALTHQKPYLVSEEIASYLHAEDVHEAMVESNTTRSDLVFKRNKRSFESVVRALKDTTLLRKLATHSQHLAQLRSPELRITKDYASIYNPETETNLVKRSLAFIKSVSSL
jgi:glycosyltransferase involved in cell wall biosynthesis